MYCHRWCAASGAALLSLVISLTGACTSSDGAADCGGADCGAVDGGAPPGLPACGDGVCNPGEGEDCASCAADCGACEADCGQASVGVDFATGVQPIFQARCVGCHDDGGAGGLDLRSHAGVLAGGDHGAAVVPCDCESSLLWRKIGPTPPFGDRMPEGGTPLSAQQIELICRWIDEGAQAAYSSGVCGPVADECTVCGDGACDASESCTTCPTDCGVCPPPGDGAGGGGGDGGDVTPPSFDGLDRTDERGDICVVSWDPAVDDQTPSNQIVYRLYVTPRDTAFDFSSPVAVTGPGATSFSLALPAGGRFDVIARAVDAAGNEDGNDRERECDMR